MASPGPWGHPSTDTGIPDRVPTFCNVFSLSVSYWERARGLVHAPAPLHPQPGPLRKSFVEVALGHVEQSHRVRLSQRKPILECVITLVQISSDIYLSLRGLLFTGMKSFISTSNIETNHPQPFLPSQFHKCHFSLLPTDTY